MNSLSSKEKAALRGVAQRLKPAARVGRKGLGEAAAKELRQAFEREELIKVAFRAERQEMDGLVAEVERLTSSQCVGGVGKKRSFYRAIPEERQGEAGPPAGTWTLTH